ncbi:MAG: hypothetical protein HYT85_18135 [candidate division NC10 bacterium]|nr:hypothetical protein [candidate division NC10 bacterium]MBI2455603.1 hypothetical protein [candidate division NC10 bacterium]
MSLESRFDVLPALSAMLSLLALLAGAGPAPAATGVERPRLSVDTTLVPPVGRTLAVPAGGNLQAALDRAQPGDVITLAPGATYTGPFVLPNKDGSAWVIVRTAAPDGSLPPPGTRVDPSYAPRMPKLEAAAGSVIVTAARAHHYRFIGIEIRPRRGAFLYNLVQLGKTERSADQLPHHIIFDRCYLHGDPEKGARRGIAMNSRDTAVIDSHLSDFKEVGADSQAIAGWNGPGPLKITNNYLEGAGENLIFGGADPSIPNLVPSDIEIRHNHFSKPLSWKIGDPTYEGTPWTIKNLFELKNARRVLVDGNLFEYNWVQAQNGFAILFTVRNQDGGAPWSVVEDVTFTNNIVRHTGSGINILGRDDIHSSQQARRILIGNNLFDDVGEARWGGGGRLFQLLNGAADVVIERNTAFQAGDIIAASGEPHTGFVYRNNITPHNLYGVGGDGTFGNPKLTLSTYFPGAVVEKNVIAGGNAAQYPPENFFPASLHHVGFLNRAGGDYRLADSSPFRGVGTDGGDVGVDFRAFSPAMAAALRLEPRRVPRRVTGRGR